MKVTNIETFIVDAGWRPWTFVKAETDDGLVGYGECSDGRSPHGVVGTSQDLKPLVIGKDPRAYEMRFWDMIRGSRQSPGGIAAKAIAGIELAFLDINLDLNFNFKPESAMRIAKVLEQFDLLWLEIDMYDAQAILQIKQSTTTKICTGENLYYMRDYLPYFQLHAADVFMVDVPWNGFSQAKKVGDLAEVYELNVAPHNYYSHLANFISASLCAVLPNVRIMEIEVDDVPWKDELATNVPEINDGHMAIPSGPGWGTDLNEEVARAHPWRGKGPGY